jgi:hypothetical protein
MPRGDLPIEARVDDPVPLLERLEVVKELIDALGVVTRSGQSHVMQRVLDLLRREILQALPLLTDGQVEAVMTAFPKLQHEAGRIAPSTVTFNTEVLGVVDVLRCTWRE